MKLSLTLVFAAITAAYAIPITKDEIEAKSAQGLRLLRLAEDADPVWKTEKEIMQLIEDDVGFVSFQVLPFFRWPAHPQKFDVTDYDPNAPDSSKPSGDVSIFACRSDSVTRIYLLPVLTTKIIRSFWANQAIHC